MSEGPAECPAERGIREIWRQVPGDYYSPSIEAFPHDGPMADAIRISVGGSVATMPVRQWHRLAFHGYDEIDHGFRIAQVEQLTAENASLKSQVSSLEAKVAAKDALLNTPELHDFSKAVVLEAAHQRERWGDQHDERKTPEDWLWALSYLATKAVQAIRYGDNEKYLHHIITTAAMCANWHRIALSPSPAPEKP